MPTYDYRCAACGHTFEEFQSITADPLKTCPQCRKRRLERVIGPGAGFLFKGEGFYITDYRSDSYAKDRSADKKAESGGATKGSGKDSGSSEGTGGAKTGEGAAKSKKASGSAKGPGKPDT